MMDDGVHAIDTLHRMWGGEAEQIKALTQRGGTVDLDFHTAPRRLVSGAAGVLLNNRTSGRRTTRVEVRAVGICTEAGLET